MSILDAIVDQLWADGLTITGIDISVYENSIAKAINKVKEIK